MIPGAGDPMTDPRTLQAVREALEAMEWAYDRFKRAGSFPDSYMRAENNLRAALACLTRELGAKEGTECEVCTERAFAHCVACAPERHRFFCRDHWLGHLEAVHRIPNESIYEAEVEDET